MTGAGLLLAASELQSLFGCLELARLFAQIREKGFHAGKDDEFDAFVLDEVSEDKVRLHPIVSFSDVTRTPGLVLIYFLALSCWVLCCAALQLLDDLEPQLGDGGKVLEFHSVDFFPERWFDLVLVLRTDNDALFDRLTARWGEHARIRARVHYASATTYFASVSLWAACWVSKCAE